MGTVYTHVAMEWAGATGLVVRSNVNNSSNTYYWPRGSSIVQVTLLSQRQPDGTCLNIDPWTTFAAEVLPNDEAITGVPSVKPGWPFTFDPP